MRRGRFESGRQTVVRARRPRVAADGPGPDVVASQLRAGAAPAGAVLSDGRRVPHLRAGAACFVSRCKKKFVPLVLFVLLLFVFCFSSRVLIQTLWPRSGTCACLIYTVGCCWPHWAFWNNLVEPFCKQIRTYCKRVVQHICVALYSANSDRIPACFMV